MSDCPECRVAEARLNHVYADACFGCRVRFVSNLPSAARLAFYATLTTDKDRQLLQTAVAMEYRRRKALIAERPVQ